MLGDVHNAPSVWKAQIMPLVEARSAYRYVSDEPKYMIPFAAAGEERKAPSNSSFRR